MQQYLSYSQTWLETRGAEHTAREIEHQPRMWRNVWQSLNQQQEKLNLFLSPLLNDPNLEIILTGAGSSAFAGDVLAPWIREKTGRRAYSYGSTEIVSNPLQYYRPKQKTLVISYARSGNSPESVAAVELADQLIDDCYHLFITCNPNSALTKYSKKSDKIYELVMPEGTHDVSFAMTSSISSMMMATVLLFGNSTLKATESIVNQVADIAMKKMTDWSHIVKKLAAYPMERIVYIGSGCFTGLARESALKILELTAGQVATRFDSILGLRHGPKFMINKGTLVVSFSSNNEYVHKYDLDLINEISLDKIAYQVVSLTGKSSTVPNSLSLETSLDDIWLVFPYLVFAQMLGFEKSLALGLTPDNPCPTGEVNRVVKGVTIYPFVSNKS